MGLTAKGAEKKRYILEKAAAVFIRAGYTAVTMKNIVDACGISRGGLYKYYSSTREIFEDILSAGKESDYCLLTMGMENGVHALHLLTDFFQQQKDEILNIENTIRIAVYEFFLAHKNSDLLNKFYTETAAVIAQTLEYGIRRNEITGITSKDVGKLANHMIIILEGLNIVALSKPVSPAFIEEQLDLFMKNLM
jgi:AcrR family transcriptional regulator